MPDLITRFLDPIDREAAIERERAGGLVAYRFRVWVILLVAALALLGTHYLKYTSVFRQSVRWLEGVLGVSDHAWTHALRAGPYAELYTHAWWAGWHYLFYLFVPMAVVKFVFRERLGAYGWQRGNLSDHAWIYGAAMVFFVVFLSWFSFHNSSFAHYYPYYRLAHRSWFDLLAWEGLYLTQFVALEFFFRGFIVQGLRVPMGSMGVAVMMVPYMMIHLPKLWPEATGAIVFGIFLGFLALRSRSIWGGVAIHASVALTLDISGVIQSHGLPTVWMAP